MIFATSRPLACLLAALIFLLTTACKKTDELFTFFIEDEEDIFIDTPFAFPINTLLPIQAVPVTTNQSQEFSQNNTHADKVKNVSLDRLTLTITDPAGKTFSFLK